MEIYKNKKYINMATQLKNLMDLALKQTLVGTKIITKEGIKTVLEFVDYDSMTHNFIIKFTNGDIQEISDKIKFEIEIDVDRPAKKTPTKNRIEK